MPLSNDDKADSDDSGNSKFLRGRARDFKDAKAKQKGTTAGKGSAGTGRNTNKRTV